MGKAVDALIKPAANVLAKDKNTRPNILPPQVTALINNTFVFQVSWGSQKLNSTRRDLIVGTAYKKTSRPLALQTTQPQQPQPTSFQQPPLSSLMPEYSRSITPSSIDKPTTNLKIHSPTHSHLKRKLSYEFDAGFGTTSSIHETIGTTSSSVAHCENTTRSDSEMDLDPTVKQSKTGPHP